MLYYGHCKNARPVKADPRKLVRPEGLRERKRRETLVRIAKSGLRLFVKNGFEATTLEAVAAAADISARTLFYYFKTKEELLQYWSDNKFIDGLRSTLEMETNEKDPLQATRDTILKLCSRYETDHSVLVDRLYRETPELRAKKRARFIELEEITFSVLIERYPRVRPERLRSVAMISFGALRLAVEKWCDDAATHQLAKYVRRQFDLLQLTLRTLS
jgi:AcrR family transcriptional regulator